MVKSRHWRLRKSNSDGDQGRGKYASKNNWQADCVISILGCTQTRLKARHIRTSVKQTIGDDRNRCNSAFSGHSNRGSCVSVALAQAGVATLADKFDGYFSFIPFVPFTLF
jgi:hypothetical protein